MQYAPKTLEDVLDDRFVEACQMLDYVEYLADLLIAAELEQRVKIVEITRRLSKWVDKIALEIGAPSEEVKKILIRKWLEPIPEDVDVTSIQYRVEEYADYEQRFGIDLCQAVNCAECTNPIIERQDD